MRGVWHRSLLALFLAVAAVPYFIGRALPHDCREELSAHDGHSEEAALNGHCAFCNLALPVAERATSAQELAVMVQRAELAVLPVPMVPPHPHECLAARGPPRS